MNDERKDRIEALKQELYKRSGYRRATPRTDFSTSRVDVASGWQNEGEKKKQFLSGGILKQVFFGSVLFFVLAVIVAVFLFFNKSNVVSSDNIDILVQGPVSIRGGEELDLQVMITNRNTVPIEAADLIVRYPIGTRSASDIAKEETTFRKFLGEIPPGETRNISLSAVLFGEERREQTVTLLLEYRTKGSNAIFAKSKAYPILISSSPINLTITLPEETSSKQEITLTVELSSNAVSELKDVLLEIRYPTGFTYKGATPLPAFKNHIWSLGDLPVGASRTIVVRGPLEGVDEEVKSFTITAGLSNPNGTRESVIPYSSTAANVIIKKPFIGITSALNGTTNVEYNGRPGERIRGDITWVNNTDLPIDDLEVVARIDGRALDKNSVAVIDGLYQSGENRIVWTTQSVPHLASLNPRDSGHVRFDFASRARSVLQNERATNPEVVIDINVNGTRQTGTSVIEPVGATITRRVKLGTEVGFSTRSTYVIGPFVNTGPLPPKAGNETSYTITWSLSNTTSDISNGEVRAILPPYMKWYGVVSPNTEVVTYDKTAGEITWNVGSLKAWAGFSGSPREVSFQVGFTPSLSQVGTYPTLISQLRFKGMDTWTKTERETTSVEASTQLLTDLGYNETKGKVVE